MAEEPEEDVHVKVHLARIDGRLSNIEQRLNIWKQCRHVTPDGGCDFHDMVQVHEATINQWTPDIKKITTHDIKINQWTGALVAVGALSAFIGGLIGALAVLLGWKK